MSQDGLNRPIGWWLKEADSLLDAAFDTALRGEEVDRRDWQVLASLASGGKSRGEVIDTLSGFDPAARVDGVIGNLETRGWIEGSSSKLQLTPSGVEKQQKLMPLVATVRQQVADALPREDYTALVGLLARLVEGLRVDNKDDA